MVFKDDFDGSIIDSSYGQVGYRVFGEGKSVVLVHGAGGSHGFWSEQVGSLDCKIITVTLPGHGGLSREGDVSVEVYAECVDLVVEELNLDEPVVIGHSMGGAITLTYALIHDVEKIGLISTGARLPIRENLLRRSRENKEVIMEFVLNWGFAPGVDERIKEDFRRIMLNVSGDTLYRDLKACKDFDLRGDLDHIRVPSLILYGSIDKMTPPSLVRELERLPNSKSEVVEGAGHMLPLERPVETNSILNNWISE